MSSPGDLPVDFDAMRKGTFPANSFGDTSASPATSEAERSRQQKYESMRASLDPLLALRRVDVELSIMYSNDELGFLSRYFANNIRSLRDYSRDLKVLEDQTNFIRSKRPNDENLSPFLESVRDSFDDPQRNYVRDLRSTWRAIQSAESYTKVNKVRGRFEEIPARKPLLDFTLVTKVFHARAAVRPCLDFLFHDMRMIKRVDAELNEKADSRLYITNLTDEQTLSFRKFSRVVLNSN